MGLEVSGKDREIAGAGATTIPCQTRRSREAMACFPTDAVSRWILSGRDASQS